MASSTEVTAHADECSRLRRYKFKFPGLTLWDVDLHIEGLEFQPMMCVEAMKLDNERVSPLRRDRIRHKRESPGSDLQMVGMIVGRK